MDNETNQIPLKFLINFLFETNRFADKSIKIYHVCIFVFKI